MSWDIAILGTVRTGGEAEPEPDDWPMPETAEGLERLLNDDACMRQILNAGRFLEFTQAYRRVWQETNARHVRDFGEQLRANLRVIQGEIE